MADPRSRTVPKGQQRGAAQEQQAFLQETEPAPPAPDDVEPQPEPIEIEGFGDASEVLFAPTDRPDEPLSAARPPSLDMQQQVPPALNYVRLSQDPSLSPEFRAMMQLGLVAQVLANGKRL